MSIEAFDVALIVSTLLAVIAWLCWKIARLHDYLSILNYCISDMLQQPRAAESIADETRKTLIAKGHVRG